PGPFAALRSTHPLRRLTATLPASSRGCSPLDPVHAIRRRRGSYGNGRRHWFAGRALIKPTTDGVVLILTKPSWNSGRWSALRANPIVCLVPCDGAVRPIDRDERAIFRRARPDRARQSDTLSPLPSVPEIFIWFASGRVVWS